MWQALFLVLSNARTMPTNHEETGSLWTEFPRLSSEQGSKQVSLLLYKAEQT